MRAAAPPLRRNSCDANATASGGEEVTPHALAGDVLTGCWELITDLRPVAFKLLGNHLGETGEGALTHFRAGDANNHAFIRAHDHPGIDLGRRSLSMCRRESEGNIEAECEPAAERGAAHDEGAAIHSGHVVHGSLPQALAAVWI